MRGFRAVYLGLFFNCVIMATVNLAAVKIANVVLGWPMGQTLLICGVLNIAFAATSGLWGVLVTDFIQFGIAMAGSFAAAYFALQQPEVGGLDGLIAQDRPGDAGAAARLRRLDAWRCRLRHPAHGAVVVGLVSGRGAGRRQLHRAAHAGGADARTTRWPARCSSTSRTTRCGRGRGSSWRWRRCSSIPQLADIQRARSRTSIPTLIGHDMAYPAMLTFLPAGFLGLMVAGLLAAYVSTISTHLNWGTSYLVHDFYRRFLQPGRRRAALRRWSGASSRRC